LPIFRVSEQYFVSANNIACHSPIFCVSDRRYVLSPRPLVALCAHKILRARCQAPARDLTTSPAEHDTSHNPHPRPVFLDTTKSVALSEKACLGFFVGSRIVGIAGSGGNRLPLAEGHLNWRRFGAMLRSIATLPFRYLEQRKSVDPHLPPVPERFRALV
jgi:hypothetical protein